MQDSLSVRLSNKADLAATESSCVFREYLRFHLDRFQCRRLCVKILACVSCVFEVFEDKRNKRFFVSTFDTRILTTVTFCCIIGKTLSVDCLLQFQLQFELLRAPVLGRTRAWHFVIPSRNILDTCKPCSCLFMQSIFAFSYGCLLSQSAGQCFLLLHLPVLDRLLVQLLQELRYSKTIQT